MIKDQMDHFVMSLSTALVREKDTVTKLVADSILVRGYVCLLFPNITVVAGRDVSLSVAHDYLRSDVVSCFLIFTLSRLGELVSGVCNALCDTDLLDDIATRLDIWASVGVIYCALMDAHDGLFSGRLKLSCVSHHGCNLDNSLTTSGR